MSWTFLEVCLTNAAHENDHKLSIWSKNEFKIDKDPTITFSRACAMPNKTYSRILQNKRKKLDKSSQI